MKKNKMMRLASWLLVLTLLTTCIISGTFAKYVTSDEAEDTARVAKWGVTTTISGALFGEHYFSNNDTSQDQISTTYTGSVDSINENITNAITQAEGTEGKIVAPGTKSENMIINISGTPEVAGEVAVEVTGTEDDTEKADYSDIWLEGAKYGVMSDVTSTVETKYDVVGLYTENADDTYTLADAEEYDPEDKDTKYYKLIDVVDASDTTSEESSFLEESILRVKDGRYYPILWGCNYFKGSSITNVNASAPEYNKVVELKDAIEKGITDEETGEEHKLNGTTFQSLNILSEKVGGMTINWEWPFNDDGVEVVDGCDTILGKLMAYDKDTSNYQVVKITTTTTTDSAGKETTTTTYTGVTVAEETIEVEGEENPVGTGVTYAKVGEGENAEKVACLTVGFNIKVTVSQVN